MERHYDVGCAPVPWSVPMSSGRRRSRIANGNGAGSRMRVVANEFMSLDGGVQAPGGPEEDTDGGFAHGGWSMPYYDPEVMGGIVGEGMNSAEALIFGRRTWQGMAAA